MFNLCCNDMFSPVSYTHLDVYKRQVLASASATAFVPSANFGISKHPIGPFHTTVFADLTAVSYTHLNDNKQAVDMGLKYVNNDACYPSLIVVGQIMDTLLSGKYDLNHTAVIITQTEMCIRDRFVSITSSLYP